MCRGSMGRLETAQSGEMCRVQEKLGQPENRGSQGMDLCGIAVAGGGGSLGNLMRQAGQGDSQAQERSERGGSVERGHDEPPVLRGLSWTSQPLLPDREG